jgi:Type I restriction enzyme HindI endonuclease subunit-like, C-terminal
MESHADARTSSGEEQGLSDEEIAFYYALAENESAVQIMGDEQLRVIAHELLTSLKGSVTVDWAHRENARARMRVCQAHPTEIRLCAGPAGCGGADGPATSSSALGTVGGTRRRRISPASSSFFGRRGRCMIGESNAGISADGLPCSALAQFQSGRRRPRRSGGGGFAIANRRSDRVSVEIRSILRGIERRGQQLPAQRSLAIKQRVQLKIEALLVELRMSRLRKMYVYLALLAYAIDAIGALILYGGVPPPGEMDDVVGRGQREADSSRPGG